MGNGVEGKEEEVREGRGERGVERKRKDRIKERRDEYREDRRRK